MILVDLNGVYNMLRLLLVPLLLLAEGLRRGMSEDSLWIKLTSCVAPWTSWRSRRPLARKMDGMNNILMVLLGYFTKAVFSGGAWALAFLTRSLIAPPITLPALAAPLGSCAFGIANGLSLLLFMPLRGDCCCVLQGHAGVQTDAAGMAC